LSGFGGLIVLTGYFIPSIGEPYYLILVGAVVSMLGAGLSSGFKV